MLGAGSGWFVSAQPPTTLTRFDDSGATLAVPLPHSIVARQVVSVKDTVWMSVNSPFGPAYLFEYNITSARFTQFNFTNTINAITVGPDSAIWFVDSAGMSPFRLFVCFFFPAVSLFDFIVVPCMLCLGNLQRCGLDGTVTSSNTGYTPLQDIATGPDGNIYYSIGDGWNVLSQHNGVNVGGGGSLIHVPVGWTLLTRANTMAAAPGFMYIVLSSTSCNSDTSYGVFRFPPGGAFEQLQLTTGTAFNSLVQWQGNLWFTEGTGVEALGRVQFPEQTIVEFGTQTEQPSGLDVLGNQLWMTSLTGNALYKVLSSAAFIAVTAPLPAVAFATLGPDGCIYFTTNTGVCSFDNCVQHC